MRPLALATAIALLAGCISAPSPADDLCAAVSSPVPTPIVSGDRTWTPTPARPDPSGTPAQVAGRLGDDRWEVYDEDAQGRMHALGHREVVIRDETAWQCFWWNENGGSTEWHPIDFTHDVVLVIALGPQEGGGHGIHVRDVERQDGSYVVHYHPVHPGPDCRVAGWEDDGGSSPQVLVRHRPVERHLPYRFERDETKVWDCLPMDADPRPGSSVEHETLASGSGGGGLLQDMRRPTMLVFDEVPEWHPLRPFLEPFAQGNDTDEGAGRLVLATLGMRGDTGYTLELESVEKAGDTVTLHFREGERGDGCITGAAITAPYLVVRLPDDAAAPNVQATLRKTVHHCER